MLSLLQAICQSRGTVLMLMPWIMCCAIKLPLSLLTVVAAPVASLAVAKNLFMKMIVLVISI